MSESLRVAFVEDNADLREAIVAYFEVSGLEVAAYSSAEAAIDGLGAFDARVVLTDLSLGRGLGGRELAHRLRSDVRHERRKIIALSGDAAAVPIGDGVFDQVVQKPIDLDQLVAIVRQLGAS